MTAIIWTKGKRITQIVRSLHANLYTPNMRICYRDDTGQAYICEGIRSIDASDFLETQSEHFPRGWQIDKGNSVDAFGFNGKDYFG